MADLVEFTLLVDGRRFVVAADEAWELAGQLNSIYGQHLDLDPHVIWEGVEVADVIEVASFGHRAPTVELVPNYVESVLESLTDDFVTELPAFAPLRDALRAAENRTAE